uniref:Uncharacterized protein n=1 Tax=Aegilops tauschii subsp. strangulata TaxID=200361 RepID=A0A453E834_AEGTS
MEDVLRRRKNVQGQQIVKLHLTLKQTVKDGHPLFRRRMGLLSALLQWNELDPPSRSEQRRNDRVCSLYQHNRNPFVDHPEYANLIWRNTARKFRSVTQKNSERLGSMSSTTKYENEVSTNY